VEWYLRRARHQAAAAFHALSDAVKTSNQELTPLGPVRR
jgi:hypothetical protein